VLEKFSCASGELEPQERTAKRNSQAVSSEYFIISSPISSL